MSRQITVNMDLDGTIYDWHSEFRDDIIAFTGRPAPDTLDRWEMWECYGISKGYWKQIFRVSVEKHDLFRRGFPIEGAVDGMWRLHDMGINVRIITNRLVHSNLHKLVVEQTVEWLDEFNIPYWSLTMFGGEHSKAGIRADFALDDSIEHLMSQVSDVKWPVVFDRPWNQNDNQFMRVKSWKEFVDQVEKYKKTLDEGQLTFNQLALI